MPRLNIVEPKSDTGPGAELLNGPLRSKQINIFKGMATNPGVLKAFLGYVGGIKTGALTDAEHEIVQLAMAQENHCEYCLAAHTQIARGAGLSDQDITGVRRGSVSNDKFQALADFTRAVWKTNGYVGDDELDAFRSAGYDDAAIIEVIAEMSVAAFTNIFNHVNETEVDFPEPATV
jgi:uncharacterized peroxidase-related enzyme